MPCSRRQLNRKLHVTQWVTQSILNDVGQVAQAEIGNYPLTDNLRQLAPFGILRTPLLRVLPGGFRHDTELWIEKEQLDASIERVFFVVGGRGIELFARIV